MFTIHLLPQQCKERFLLNMSYFNEEPYDWHNQILFKTFYN